MQGLPFRFAAVVVLLAGTVASDVQGQTPEITKVAQELGLSTALGRLLIADDNALYDEVMTESEFVRAQVLFDLIRLKLNPELAADMGSDTPLCLANRYLNPAESNALLEPASDDGGRRLREWRGAGDNEFEVQRAQQDFLSNHLPGLVAAAPELPLEFVYVSRVLLDSYDTERGGFPMRGMPEDRLELPAGPCMGDGRDLELANIIPDFWMVDAETAERDVVRRIPVDDDFGGHTRRVYAATVFSLTAVPASYVAPDNQGNERVPLVVEIQSIAFYEDKELTQLLQTLPLALPKPAVLLAGLPTEAPPPEWLDEETFALLLLKEDENALDDAAWETLAERHRESDETYYSREGWTYSAEGTPEAVEFSAFDPDYTPFLPSGFPWEDDGGIDDPLMQLFREWTLLRAAELLKTINIPATLARDYDTGLMELKLGAAGD
jgi:hypothetical protein